MPLHENTSRGCRWTGTHRRINLLRPALSIIYTVNIAILYAYSDG
jgi:hypothetical protein